MDSSSVFFKFVNEFGLPWAVALVLAGVVWRLIWYILKQTISRELHDTIVNDKLKAFTSNEAKRDEALETLSAVTSKMLTMLEVLIPLISGRSGRS